MHRHGIRLLEALQKRFPNPEFTFEGNDPLRLHVVVNGVHTPIRVQPQDLIDKTIESHGPDVDVEAEILAATIIEVARYIRPKDAAWQS